MDEHSLFSFLASAAVIIVFTLVSLWTRHTMQDLKSTSCPTVIQPSNLSTVTADNCQA